MPPGWLDRRDRGGRRRGDVARMRERPRSTGRIQGPELGSNVSPSSPSALPAPSPSKLDLTNRRESNSQANWSMDAGESPAGKGLAAHAEPRAVRRPSRDGR